MARWGSNAPLVKLNAYEYENPSVPITLYSFDFNNVVGINLTAPKWIKEGSKETSINGNLVEMIKGFRFSFRLSYELEKDIPINEDCITFIEKMAGWAYKLNPFIENGIVYADPFIELFPHSDNTDFKFNVYATIIESKYLGGLLIGYEGTIEFVSVNLFNTIPQP